MIGRALPDAWSMAYRDDILATRLDLARDALAPGLADADVERLAKELTAIWTSLDFAGKGLAAAHTSLPMPDDPIGRLWHATSILREYRGDCHVAILTAAGLDGAAANALAVADGRVPATQREMRGWTEEEWAEAYERLRRRALDRRVRHHHRERPGGPRADRGRHRSRLRQQLRRGGPGPHDHAGGRAGRAPPARSRLPVPCSSRIPLGSARRSSALH